MTGPGRHADRQTGPALQPGQSLLSVLPDAGEWETELCRVPGRATGFIEPGDAAMLRYHDAYPYQKFGYHLGNVTPVSHSAPSSGELGALMGDVQAGGPYARVTVALARQAITAMASLSC